MAVVVVETIAVAVEATKLRHAPTPRQAMVAVVAEAIAAVAAAVPTAAAVAAAVPTAAAVEARTVEALPLTAATPNLLTKWPVRNIPAGHFLFHNPRRT